MSEPMTREEAASVLGHINRQKEALARLREEVEAEVQASRAAREQAEKEGRERLAVLDLEIAARQAELQRLTDGISELRAGLNRIAE